MKISRTIIAFVLALPLLSCATDQHTADIDQFIERREICDHLRGEFPDPPNPERTKEITDGIKEYCTRTDAQLATLKIRYADSPAIMNKLNAYEPRIERKNPKPSF